MKPNCDLKFSTVIALTAFAFIAVLGLVAATVGPPYDAGGGGYVRVNHLAVNINTPAPITVGTEPVTIMTERISGAQGRVLVRTVQNTGTVPVLFAIGSTVSATTYHGVLAGGAVAKDGLGSILDLSNWRGTVSFMTESGETTLAPMEMTQ